MVDAHCAPFCIFFRYFLASLQIPCTLKESAATQPRPKATLTMNTGYTSLASFVLEALTLAHAGKRGRIGRKFVGTQTYYPLIPFAEDERLALAVEGRHVPNEWGIGFDGYSDDERAHAIAGGTYRRRPPQTYPATTAADDVEVDYVDRLCGRR